MLHLARGITLGVNVGNLLQLQRAFQCDRVMNPAPQIQKIRLPEILPRQRLVKSCLLRLQDRLHLVRNPRELQHQLTRRFRRQLAPHLPQVRRQQHQRRQLRRKRFCRRHANFRSRMRQNRPCGLPRNHRAFHVANRQAQRALLLRLPLRRQRVRRLPRLADAHRQRPRINNRIPITELAAVVHFHRQPRQPLNHEFSGQPRVPARPACHNPHALEFAKRLLRNRHLIQKHLAGIL